MATLRIVDGVASAGEDTHVEVGEVAIPESGELLLTLERFAQEGPALRAAGRVVGVVVPGETEPEALSALLGEVDLIAVRIPKFTDGRAYSLARLLRVRHGYAGPLLALGDVLRDQLAYLARVGFDRLALAPQVGVEDALAAFEDFSGAYQPSTDQATPRWRR